MKGKYDDKGQLNWIDSDSLFHYLDIEDDAEKNVQRFKLWSWNMFSYRRKAINLIFAGLVSESGLVREWNYYEIKKNKKKQMKKHKPIWNTCWEFDIYVNINIKSYWQTLKINWWKENVLSAKISLKVVNILLLKILR